MVGVVIFLSLILLLVIVLGFTSNKDKSIQVVPVDGYGAPPGSVGRSTSKIDAMSSITANPRRSECFFDGALKSATDRTRITQDINSRSTTLGSGDSTSVTISNHGGTMMSGINLYLIHYDDATSKNVGTYASTPFNSDFNGLNTFVSDFQIAGNAANASGSNYWNINRTYTGVGSIVSMSYASVPATSTITNKFKKSDSSTGVLAAITAAVTNTSTTTFTVKSGQVTPASGTTYTFLRGSGGDTLGTPGNTFSMKGLYDPNGIYIVVPSYTVSKQMPQFLVNWCGWHSYFSSGSKKIKYAVIGNPRTGTTDVSSYHCSALTGASASSGDPYRGATVSGNAAVDSMASVIAHEIEEAASDPVFTGYYVNSGSYSGDENADICAWYFPSVNYVSSSTKPYNVTMNTRNYLLQGNFPRLGGSRNDCIASHS